MILLLLVVFLLCTFALFFSCFASLTHSLSETSLYSAFLVLTVCVLAMLVCVVICVCVCVFMKVVFSVSQSSS